MTEIKKWENLTIKDNLIFQRVMCNPRLCKHIIEKILSVEIAKIEYIIEEKNIEFNPDSKSVRLDVYVNDDAGTVYDIEMQCTAGKEGELAKRTRYYQAMIDMEILDKGKSYSELKPSYIIFICTFDLFKQGLPIYTFKNTCVENNNIELGDKATKLFLNSKSHMEGIAQFLDYVNGHAPQGEFVKEIDEEVQKVKADKEWRKQYMTWAMDLKIQGEREKGIEIGIEIGIEQGIKRGIEQERLKTIKSLLKAGLSTDKIADILQISVKSTQRYISLIKN